MKIKAKYFVLNIFVISSIIIILLVSLWSAYQINQLERTISTGFSLIAETRAVHNLMKDLVFDMFMPQMYNLLKDLTYSPSTTSLTKSWIEQNDKFKESLYSFLNSNELRFMLKDPDLNEKYNAAMNITNKTFEQIEGLKKSLVDLQNRGLLGDEELYYKLQSSDVYSKQQFFNQLRNTNYYITFTFESYMNYFINSLKAQANFTQQSIIIFFTVVVLAVGVMIILSSYFISRSIANNLQTVKKSIRILAQGDFTTKLRIKSNDEFNELFNSMNLLYIELKNNINSVLTIMHKVGLSIDFDLRHIDLINIISKTILDNAKIDGVLYIQVNESYGSFQVKNHYGEIPLLKSENTKHKFKIKDSFVESILGRKSPLLIDKPASGAGMEMLDIDLPRVKSLLLLPIFIGHDVSGILILITLLDNEVLNDLDFFKLQAFSEYAGLLIDNYLKYSELLKKKEAEYMALQFQVQPHFLYNILNNFIGLNRKGETKILEESIFALKDMMRYTTQRNYWTSVGEEFEFLEKYLQIQKTRFGERLKYGIECEKRTRHFKIPKLLLQPIVENAVIHGIEPLQADGMIDVSSNLIDSGKTQYLEIRITDNGPGFNMKKLSSRKSVGLKNVKERIAHIFPKAVFHIKSNEGAGSLFSLKIQLGDLKK